MNVNDLLYKKEGLTSTLKEIMTRYLLNKMHELNDENSKSEFQKKLYEIPNWSERKREKEFARFLKYIYKKFRVSESELNSMISDIIFLNIKILTRSPIEINAPDSQTFWYKLINLTGRHFYNKIKYKISETQETLDKEYIEKFIDIFFQKYVPFNDIISNEVEKVSYHFGDDVYAVDVYDGDGDQVKNDVYDEINLKFISPDYFYYKQNEDKDILDTSSAKDIYIKQKLNLL